MSLSAWYRTLSEGSKRTWHTPSQIAVIPSNLQQHHLMRMKLLRGSRRRRWSMESRNEVEGLYPKFRLN